MAKSASFLAAGLACLLLVSSCSASLETMVKVGAKGETGSVCAPRGIDQAAMIDNDVIENTSDEDVIVEGISLDSATGVKLLASRLQKDMGAGVVGPNDGNFSGLMQPTVLTPGEQAFLGVVLQGTTPGSFGWTEGLWVTVRTSKTRLRAHTCFRLLVAPGDTCSTDGEPADDDDTLKKMCGRMESV